MGGGPPVYFCWAAAGRMMSAAIRVAMAEEWAMVLLFTGAQPAFDGGIKLGMISIYQHR